MRDLDAPAVRDWLHELERKGRAQRTITKAKVALSAMLACAAEDGDIGSNPATAARYVPSSRQEKPKPKNLTAADVRAVLNAMPERWQAFFFLLAQTGVRIGELLGLRWRNVHLGDDPYIYITEQVTRGRRKQTLETAASRGKVPLSPGMASWLAEVRPEDQDAPVFPSRTGTALNYSNVYHRVLRPALIEAGVARQTGTDAKGRPTYSLDGRASHHFRHAAGSLLHAEGRTVAHVQHWLRHGDPTITLGTYTHLADDGLGGADVWDEILPRAGGTNGPNRGPEGAFRFNVRPLEEAKAQ